MILYALDNRGSLPRGYWLPYNMPVTNPPVEFTYSSSAVHSWKGLRRYARSHCTQSFCEPNCVERR